MGRKSRDVPWLQKRNGVYYAFWWDGAKRRIERFSLRTKDPSTAQTRFAAFLVEGVSIRQSGSAETSGVTVSAALDAYRREHIVENCVSVARFEDAAFMLEEWFGDMLLKDVDITSCKSYAIARQTGMLGSREVTGSTVRRELGVLKAAAAHAVTHKRITRAEEPVIVSPEEGEARAVYLEKDELAAILAAATGELADWIRITYHTGSRRQATTELTVFQVNLKANTIDLHPPGTKRTKKRRPVVPIFPEIRPIVERLVTAAIAAGRPRLFETNRFYDTFSRLVVNTLGSDEKAFPHILRHSRVTHLLQDGADPWAVARLVGMSVQTLDRVYGHHSPAHLERALTKRDFV